MRAKDASTAGSPAVGAALFHMAEPLIAKKEYTRAKALLERSLRIRYNTLGQEALETRATLGRLGEVAELMGDAPARAEIADKLKRWHNHAEKKES